MLETGGLRFLNGTRDGSATQGMTGGTAVASRRSISDRPCASGCVSSHSSRARDGRIDPRFCSTTWLHHHDDEARGDDRGRAAR